jgi:hypothetical protein
MDPHLCADDCRLLDALMESGFDRNYLSAVSRADNQRLDAISSTLGLLRDYPVDDADETLVHATLARIDRIEDTREARLKFDNQQAQSAFDGESRWRFRIRVPDFITVAAVILIGVSVCWPVLHSMRQQSMVLACANNMKNLGYAFGQYASDHRGAVPMAMAGPALTWDKVSNALNLEPLISGHYCESNHLNCPGHEHRAESARGVMAVPTSSYSYRAFGSGAPNGWQTMRVTVILGDLNPVVDAALAGRFAEPLSVSLNHGGRGQNVLWSDGSDLWLPQPVVSRDDNIWLPRGAGRLTGGEQPADEADIFLTQ